MKAASVANERIAEPGLTSIAEILHREHSRLATVCSRLLDAYRAGAWSSVIAEWQVFESTLLAHMAVEEAIVFSRFARTNRVEAEALLEEHDAIRQRLEALGINIELHAVPMKDADELIARLRAHADREERLLYPWIDATFPSLGQSRP